MALSIYSNMKGENQFLAAWDLQWDKKPVGDESYKDA